MTDDLDDLTAALRARPAADPAAKARAMALAMKNFDAGQGLQPTPRPSQDRRRTAGFLKGLRDMLTPVSLRGYLAATTSAAVLGLGLVVVLPPLSQPHLAPPASDLATTDAPGAAAPPQTESAARSAPDGTAGEPPAPVAEAKVESAGTKSAAAASAPMADAIATTQAGPDAEADAPASPFAATSTEAYSDAPQNALKVTAEHPVSTFSIDVDTTSYAVVRSSLMNGALPPPEAVRIEEMVNYFPYDYPAPEGAGAPFRSTVSVMQTPWNPGTRLVRIGLQGRMPALADRPPLNLVFLIDTSGSMDEPNKLPLLKQSLSLMLAQMRAQDEMAIVAYAGAAGTVLEPTPAADTAKISAALAALGAGGSTAGGAGLALAYDVARTMSAQGEVSRVVLATDGDFNVGIDDPDQLKAFIAAQRDSGVYLSVLGFGRGNLDDATLQALAQTGNGQAAYIDTPNEARKVLVDQLTGALFPIADDVKIQVEWNPAAVAEYRLIGYETRALNREDFNNDSVDAGEIGAGHAVTALYEVTAPGSAALRTDPLRYGADADVAGDTVAADGVAAAGDAAELGYLRLRYKAPGAGTSTLIQMPVMADSVATDDARFAAAIAGFGQLLTASPYLNGWGWDAAIDLALGARGEDPFGYRIEAVNLMRLAKTLRPD